jgi:deoxyribodipyrimidine photo-lyase
MHTVHPARVRRVRDGAGGTGPVVYWMSRDQRADENWALLHARDCADDAGVPLVVVFCLSRTFLGATRRQYDFMLRGLAETAQRLRQVGIPFTVLRGAAPETLPGYLAEVRAARLVTDFDPLRLKQQWLADVARAVACTVDEVDAHNIVPCRHVSDKQEYAARTIRPKIHRMLDEFLEPFPDLTPPRASGADFGMDAPDADASDVDALRSWVQADAAVPAVDLPPGAEAGLRRMEDFLQSRIRRYHETSSDPTVDGVSMLSPYLHFGQVSPQRVALAASACGRGEGVTAFLEQLVVRRELTDNFCLHNERYDSLDGAPDWARRTLDAHRDDARPHLYTREAFERAQTHSALWNAAQLQMVRTGFMHNYMRMFWAKKILEWSRTPEEALETAIYLNDRYQLDGRDPNGYVGVMWSIGGVHDRGWREREVLGTVRYMNERGCRRKFDVDAYIRAYGNAQQQMRLL